MSNDLPVVSLSEQTQWIAPLSQKLLKNTQPFCSLEATRLDENQRLSLALFIFLTCGKEAVVMIVCEKCAESAVLSLRWQMSVNGPVDSRLRHPFIYPHGSIFGRLVEQPLQLLCVWRLFSQACSLSEWLRTFSRGAECAVWSDRDQLVVLIQHQLLFKISLFNVQKLVSSAIYFHKRFLCHIDA